MIELVLMRHGRSRADDEDVHEGRYDSPLTAVGEAQVRSRAEQFKAQGLKLDAVVCSSLQRAHTTARLVAEILGTPEPGVDPGWMEFNNGPLAGLSYEEAEQRFPMPSFRGPYEPFFGTGESEFDFHARVGAALQRVIQRGAGSYLVVGHGGSLNAALRVLAGIPLPFNRHGMWFAFADTGFVRLRYNPGSHSWLLIELSP
jgi:2,3-bisphosphoglycerate-dependent phosphoglycerate mutase